MTYYYDMTLKKAVEVQDLPGSGLGLIASKVDYTTAEDLVVPGPVSQPRGAYAESAPLYKQDLTQVSPLPVWGSAPPAIAEAKHDLSEREQLERDLAIALRTCLQLLGAASELGARVLGLEQSLLSMRVTIQRTHGSS
jgi:hypothetical protein